MPKTSNSDLKTMLAAEKADALAAISAGGLPAEALFAWHEFSRSHKGARFTRIPAATLDSQVTHGVPCLFRAPARWIRITGWTAGQTLQAIS